MTERSDRRLQTRLRLARLRRNACVEDIDYRHRRGLDKRLMKFDLETPNRLLKTIRL